MKDRKESSKENQEKKKFKLNPIFTVVILVILVGCTIGGTKYWQYLQSRIYIEKSEISAPIILLGPQNTTLLETAVLDRVFVRAGDIVRENQIVAMINAKPIKSKINGLVIGVQNTPGQVISSQGAIVQMIDPNELRVVGHIEEDKGLSDIMIGQKVVFTADAFGSKVYNGIVDSISPTSRQSDIVFSISDKRQEKEFDIKVKYDLDAYPELRNGMSAKMWVYK